MRTFTLAVAAAAAESALAARLPIDRPGSKNMGRSWSTDAEIPSTSGFHDAFIAPSKGGAAICVSGKVPVTASTNKNIKLNFQAPKNQTGVTEVVLDFATSGSTFAQQVMDGEATVSGTYNIAASLCLPKNDTSPKAVQFLTHGVGFDHTYWDFAPGYSYVDVAAEHNYATFLYDRLGQGMSEKPADGVNVVQAPFEVEIAHGLISALSGGNFSKLAFDTIVGVGHSFGSAVTQAITAEYPSALSGAVLTGFSTNSTATKEFFVGLNLALANRNQPTRFAGVNDDYLVADSTISNQIGFFRAPNFDPVILDHATATKGSLSWGEFFTSSAVGGVAKGFTKPIAVVDGAEDFPFCNGNCSYPTNLAAAVRPALYPNVPEDKFAAYLAPTTGHGLNLHYSATAAFVFIQDFLKKTGLGA